MPALPTLLPTGDSAVGLWTTDSGGVTNLWQKTEEGIAGATDTTDFIKGPNDTNNTDYKFTFTATPAGFGSIKTLNWNVRYALSGTPPASNKDTYGLSIRIVNGATILAAADSGGTFQVIVSTTTMATSFANSGVAAFTYVNTSASKTQWDGAVVELRQTYIQTASKDAHAVEVSAIEFTGTYNAILSANVGSYAQSGVNVTFARTRILSANTGIYAQAGASLALNQGHKISLGVGSYSDLGASANLLFGRTLKPAVGAYSVTGANPSLLIGHKMVPDVGIFTKAGNDLTLAHGYVLAISTGLYQESGTALTFSRTYIMSPVAGSLAHAGIALNLLTGRRLAAEVGSFVETGQTAGLLAGRRLPVDAGVYTLAGASSSLTASRRLFLDTGTYIETGSNPDLLVGHVLALGNGNYAAIGVDISLIFAQGGNNPSLVVDVGAIEIHGIDVGLLWNQRLTVDEGQYLISGSVELIAFVHGNPDVFTSQQESSTWAVATNAVWSSVIKQAVWQSGTEGHSWTAPEDSSWR